MTVRVVRVANELGRAVGERIRREVPGVEVVDLRADDPMPADGADVLYGGWSPPEVFVDRAREVRWVQFAGTGVDRVPAEVLDGRVVTCAGGASAIPIAEWVLASMLAFEEHIPELWCTEPPENWNLAEKGTLFGRTLGLVGLGGIGGAVAERALPFGMRVLAVRRSERPSPVAGVELVSFDELLASADHLVLAAPATARTRHLIDEATLARVKRGVHLVNVARGALVDQDALRRALDGGQVARASLDAVEPEPLPAGHWMYDHPGVRLSAHVSWASPMGIDRTVEQFVANLRRFVAGEPLHHVVDAAEGY